MSDLGTVPFPFSVLGFLTGADLFIPADPPSSMVEAVPRGDFGAARTVPNIPSSEGRVVIPLEDFEQ